MIVLRTLDIVSMKLFNLQKSDKYPIKGYKFVILNMFGVSITMDDSLKGAVGICFEFLPLRLFIGFNVSNRWII